jgi:hypothetical protein
MFSWTRQTETAEQKKICSSRNILAADRRLWELPWPRSYPRTKKNEKNVAHGERYGATALAIVSVTLHGPKTVSSNPTDLTLRTCVPEIIRGRKSNRREE